MNLPGLNPVSQRDVQTWGLIAKRGVKMIGKSD